MRAVLHACVLSAVTVFCSCGCGTTGAGRTDPVEIRVIADGRLSVEGRVVTLARLARQVKAAGATASTPILVEVPDGLGQGQMVEITRNLRRGGFVRVVFKRRRKTHAAVQP